MVQWLGVFTFIDNGSGSFPSRGTKILKAVHPGQINKQG